LAGNAPEGRRGDRSLQAKLRLLAGGPPPQALRPGRRLCPPDARGPLWGLPMAAFFHLAVGGTPRKRRCTVISPPGSINNSQANSMHSKVEQEVAYPRSCLRVTTPWSVPFSRIHGTGLVALCERAAPGGTDIFFRPTPEGLSAFDRRRGERRVVWPSELRPSRQLSDCRFIDEHGDRTASQAAHRL
jgi:hypothetical protein